LKGFLLYRIPGSAETQQLEGIWRKITDTELLTTTDGFIFCDFLKETIFHFTPLKEVSGKLKSADFYRRKNMAKVGHSKNDYLATCNKFIEACISQNLSKVVLSRTKEVDLPVTFDVLKFFILLCTAYTHAFNYLVSIPEIGCWTGATPEQLLVRTKNNYSTVSLAGTRTVDDTQPFTDKEKEEQQLVTEYIEETLRKKNISFTRNELPEISRAGNLLHLKTTFAAIQTENPLELALSLHPTPAVCGLPVDKSKDFIARHEGHNRSFYSGFLGLVDNEKFAVYVNLRCAEIFDTGMRLFVGGGITSQSSPELEWEETENKSQTLLSVLAKSLM
jgi:isochorismate synthase